MFADRALSAILGVSVRRYQCKECGWCGTKHTRFSSNEPRPPPVRAGLIWLAVVAIAYWVSGPGARFFQPPRPGQDSGPVVNVANPPTFDGR